jgi:hypothetical protein
MARASAAKAGRKHARTIADTMASFFMIISSCGQSLKPISDDRLSHTVRLGKQSTERTIAEISRLETRRGLGVAGRGNFLSPSMKPLDGLSPFAGLAAPHEPIYALP